MSLVDSLVEDVRDARVLLLASYRPEQRPAWRERPHCTEVVLEPLSSGSAEALLEDFLGSTAEMQPLTPHARRAHRRQRALPRGERARAHRERGAGGRPRRLSPGQAAGQHPDSRSRAGGARRPHRPAARGPQELPAGGRGDRQGPAGHAAAGGGGCVVRPGPRQPGRAGRGAVPQDHQPLPGSRLLVPARAHARRGLRQHAQGPAPQPARAHRRRAGVALSRAARRARRAPGPPRPRRRAVVRGGRLPARGGGQGGRPLGQPGGGGVPGAGAGRARAPAGVARDVRSGHRRPARPATAAAAARSSGGDPHAVRGSGADGRADRRRGRGRRAPTPT